MTVELYHEGQLIHNFEIRGNYEFDFCFYDNNVFEFSHTKNNTYVFVWAGTCLKE